MRARPPSLLLALLAQPALALHPLITDDTGTQGRGRTQLELTGEFERTDDADATGLESVLAYGPLDSLDIAFAVPYSFIHTRTPGAIATARGLGDAGIEFKWRVSGPSGWSLALKPILRFTTGDETRGMGSGATSFSAFALVSKEFKRAAFHFNAGVDANQNKLGEHRGLWHVSAAAGAQVLGRLQALVNVAVDRRADPASTVDPAVFVGGLIYPVGEDIDLSLGVKTGLNSAYRGKAYLLGTAIRF